MLQLQRASAGSGKTYALAKKYIWCLITISEEGCPARFRTKAEIIDGLPRILAITFTNKATNEMKQRIVDKLAALARFTGEGKHPDYLDEFTDELGCDPARLAEACASALSVLLNDYSDFKVSTIDSFFQTVLRTFAYETDLNDTYQIELDNDYLAASALDVLFDDINHRRNPRAEYWLSLIMERDVKKGGAWNVFRRSTSSNSTYRQLLDAIKKLDNEDFKVVRESLHDYLGRREDLPGLYRGFSRRINGELRRLHSEAVAKARSLESLFAARGLNLKTDGRANLASQLGRIMASSHDVTPNAKFIDWSDGKPAVKILKKATKKSPEIYPCDAATAGELTLAATDAYAALGEWLGYLDSPAVRHWRAYDRLFPYLGLILEVQEYIRVLLETGNLLQLGETNSILRRIIGEDDTPFVYERLGTRLNHYLIDEFQDTSRLQWHNLRPLLCESESRDNYNLVIGDAKQSIYRFRNADPSLITDVVPRDFPNRVPEGDMRRENTNWRSRRTIVEFNNLFFRRLSSLVPNDGSGAADLTRLYSNTVQYPRHREREGYVEIRFLNGDTPVPTDGNDDGNAEGYPHLPPLLSRLRRRGYRWRDMAVLVSTHVQGSAAIDSIVAYNASLPEGEEPIEFISEESLKVSSARSVRMVVSALEALDNARDPKRLFNFYALQHPDLDSADILRRYFPKNGRPPEGDSPLDEMVAGMQTVSLPALTDEIIRTFVPAAMRDSEAMFLAAFQDLVLGFCEGHAADVSSFLEWWRVKGEKTPVSSPEGTDAVQIMTIHKSKGLEFRCVVLPEANQPLRASDRNPEWRWVNPSAVLDPDRQLPPFLPVLTDKSIADTDHEGELRTYHDLYTMDKVNQYYVAFTRAVDELYIFTALPKQRKNEESETGRNYNLGGCLKHILWPAEREAAERVETLDLPEEQEENPEEAELLLPRGMIKAGYGANGELSCITVGSPCEVVGFGEEDEKRFMLDEYAVGRVGFEIKYRSSGLLSAEKGSDDEEEDPEYELDLDPRSEGNLMHSVLENVRTAADLSFAVLKMQTKGLFTRQRGNEIREYLERALERETVRDWFSPGWRVLNERDILQQGKRNRRPDRILMSEDGSRVVIIDYKFGAVPKGNVHRRQVAGYVGALRAALGATGLRPALSAWLW